jgi:hypothetical protein
MAPTNDRAGGRADGDRTSRPDYVRVTDLLLKVGIELNHYADHEPPSEPPNEARVEFPASHDAALGTFGASWHLIIVDAALLSKKAELNAALRQNVALAFVHTVSEAVVAAEAAETAANRANGHLESISLLFDAQFRGTSIRILNRTIDLAPLEVEIAKANEADPRYADYWAVRYALRSIVNVARQPEIYVYACGLASNAGFRRAFVGCGYTVLGSTDVTGPDSKGNNWAIEWTNDNLQRKPTQAQRTHASTALFHEPGKLSLVLGFGSEEAAHVTAGGSAEEAAVNAEGGPPAHMTEAGSAEEAAVDEQEGPPAHVTEAEEAAVEEEWRGETLPSESS